MMAVVASARPSAFFHLAPNPNSNPQPPKRRRPFPPPISISTNPSHLDPLQLRDLFAAAGHSCHRFPALAADGRPEPVDPARLRRALAHSFVVVSVFCHVKFLAEDRDDGVAGDGVSGFSGFEDLFERAVPEAESDRKLVGFGRAVSDGGLTASIHDIVVVPSLQRLGIGRKIVERILRILRSKGIYDISALCSENERLFFKACSFGDDCLGSTTMIYTRSVLSYLKDEKMVKPAGRMLLLVPSAREPYA